MRGASWADQPLVSVVTPTLNRAGLLRWTINSVRNQTYSNIEHIVMDGASTDETVALLRDVERTYPLQWHSQADTGMYPAINHGLQLSKGEILAYLNSDDLYFPWTVEVVVEAFRRHPEVDFVFGDALTIEEATGKHILYWLPPFDLDDIRRSGFLAQPTVFWRRSAFEAVGPFDETLRYVADCDYWMRAGTRHRFLKIKEFLALERNHGSTLRQTVRAPLLSELERVRSRYVSLSGPEHTSSCLRHARRRAQWERAYKLGLLLQSLVPASVRRGPWSRLLNSRLVEVERVRYVLRAMLVGKYLPGVRRWAARDFLRPNRSILEPAWRGPY